MTCIRPFKHGYYTWIKPKTNLDIFSLPEIKVNWNEKSSNYLSFSFSFMLNTEITKTKTRIKKNWIKTIKNIVTKTLSKITVKKNIHI